MKAFEAKNGTKQAVYYTIIKEISESIKDGSSMRVFHTNSDFYKSWFTDEIIEMLLEDGFDVTLSYNCFKQLYAVCVSWKDSQKMKRGVLTVEKEAEIPEKETKGFFDRLFDSLRCDDFYEEW